MEDLTLLSVRRNDENMFKNNIIELNFYLLIKINFWKNLEGENICQV